MIYQSYNHVAKMQRKTFNEGRKQNMAGLK